MAIFTEQWLVEPAETMVKWVRACVPGPYFRVTLGEKYRFYYYYYW